MLLELEKDSKQSSLASGSRKGSNKAPSPVCTAQPHFHLKEDIPPQHRRNDCCFKGKQKEPPTHLEEDGQEEITPFLLASKGERRVRQGGNEWPAKPSPSKWFAVAQKCGAGVQEMSPLSAAAVSVAFTHKLC